MNFSQTRHVTTDLLGRRLTLSYRGGRHPTRELNQCLLYARKFDHEFPINPWRVFRTARLELNLELKRLIPTGAKNASRIAEIKEILARYDELTGCTLSNLPQGARCVEVAAFLEQLETLERAPEAYALPSTIRIRSERGGDIHYVAIKIFLNEWRIALRKELNERPFVHDPAKKYPSDWEHWNEIRRVVHVPLDHKESSAPASTLVMPAVVVPDMDPVLCAAGEKPMVADFKTNVTLQTNLCVNSNQERVVSHIADAIEMLESCGVSATATGNFLTLCVEENSLDSDTWDDADHIKAYHRACDRMSKAVDMVKAMLAVTEYRERQRIG